MPKETLMPAPDQTPEKPKGWIETQPEDAELPTVQIRETPKLVQNAIDSLKKQGFFTTIKFLILPKSVYK